ncbi:acyl-CoA dehydrogenase family protein [Sphingopyxis sp.]|uniref:acyl-CoA dehydrogenase family protein n=1 Tax=Sphingopyxis sp. TaxID=1908224 RepID=UPI002FC78553
MVTATLSRHAVALALGGSANAHNGTDPSTGEIEEMLRSAEAFAQRWLVPLNAEGDRTGSRLVGGRVVTPASHKPAWRAYRDDGWLLIDADPAHGGLGLPTGVASAVQEIFDRACPAFGMMPVPIRAGSRLLAAYGSAEQQAEWLPRLASGDWGATICISEPDAGSDVRRIRTSARPSADGRWSIEGEKCWISFGDQDLTDRIGHFLLAKTGTDRISLFLVPDRFGATRNRIVVRRVEEKLGLHLSPTCALGFEGATGFLLGEEGRGLQQLFVMIRHMRLATAVQGAGIAAQSYATAKAYAAERRQGGSGPLPVPIETHADIQRQLLSMAARLECLRGLIQIAAKHIDRADRTGDPEQRAHSAALTAWLLPIVKTMGGETGFDVASDAIQILGGAGYTKEWPVEQRLRDARVLTIFEGTTGMQAQDLLFRQLRKDGGAPYRAFLTEARCEAENCPPLAEALDCLEQTTARLTHPGHDARAAEWSATGYLALASAVAAGWIAAALLRTAGDDDAARHLRAAGAEMIDDMLCRLPYLEQAAVADAPDPARFGALI